MKRLVRFSERLMQLAQAEGGRLRLDHASDMRPAVRIVVDDIGKLAASGRIRLTLPDTPVHSDLDPDIFGFLCRYLVENALRHGEDTKPVEVGLTSDETLIVSIVGPALPPEMLARLTHRFERAGTDGDVKGLGLSIMNAIANRSQG